MQLKAHVVLVVALGIVVTAGPSFSQAPPFVGLYAAPHLFALPSATTTRLFGMGGFVTCIKDAGFANPAYAGTLAGWQSVDRVSYTNFSGGLDLRGMQVSFALPLRTDESGLQVTYFDLDSGRGAISLAGAPFLATLEEKDLAIHYGHRLSDKWVVGLGLGPKMDTESNLYSTVPAVALFAHLESDADVGFRLGSLYQMDEAGWAGFVYDCYNEDVKWSWTFPPPGGTGAGTFKSEEIAVGVSRQVSDKVLAAIEWQQVTTEGMGLRDGESGIRLGAEVAASESWALRAGWNDGALSLGAGWTGDKWSFEYAYVRDWNDDALGSVLAGSDTHQLGFRRCW